jgi:hypothetical protein
MLLLEKQELLKDRQPFGKVLSDISSWRRYLWFFMLSTRRKNFPQTSHDDNANASFLWVLSWMIWRQLIKTFFLRH